MGLSETPAPYPQLKNTRLMLPREDVVISPSLKKLRHSRILRLSVLDRTLVPPNPPMFAYMMLLMYRKPPAMLESNFA